VDDEAFFRKNRDDLVRYATVLVGPSNAEDVVSTVVLRVLARRRLMDLNDARAYLFRGVLNESRTWLTRRRSSPTVDDVADTPMADPQPEVLAAVLALPAQQRAATYLVYWEGQSIAEASALMGIRPGTAKRYLHLARRTLKGVLDAN
jgi:RNA polymerase sigma-70 factor (ECF subfamily)